jgi:hypothetical protein
VGSIRHSLSISLDNSWWRWSPTDSPCFSDTYTNRILTLHYSLCFVIHLESTQWSTLPKENFDFFSGTQGCNNSPKKPPFCTTRNYLIRDAMILPRIVENSLQISVRDDLNFRGGMSVID